MPEAPTPLKVPRPPCPRCSNTERVITDDPPEFPRVRRYRCESCRRFWLTNLDGELILRDGIDESWAN